MPEKVGHTVNCTQYSPELRKRQSHCISLICIQFETVTGSNLVFVSSEVLQGPGLGFIIHGLSWLAKCSLLSKCLEQKEKKILWVSHWI